MPLITELKVIPCNRIKLVKLDAKHDSEALALLTVNFRLGLKLLL